MIFISHDLSVVHEVAHRILVLYLGRTVELADRNTICTHRATPIPVVDFGGPDPGPQGRKGTPAHHIARRIALTLGAGRGLRFLPSKRQNGGLMFRNWRRSRPGISLPSMTRSTFACAGLGVRSAEHDPLEVLLAQA